MLYDAFGEREIATTYTSLNQYYVVMVVDPSFWQDPTALRNIYVASSSGGMVPLSAFTHYEPDTAPLAVNHSSVFPSVTFSFNLAPGVALGDAVKLINATEAKAGMPSTITGSFSGTAQAFSASLSSEPLLHRGGGRRGVRGARHSVRELHPSGHHPLDAALGGRRCAARAAPDAYRAQRHCAHRHHPAHRPRQEERHHDDRLRDRGGTARSQDSQGGGIRGIACCASGRS